MGENIRKAELLFSETLARAGGDGDQPGGMSETVVIREGEGGCGGT